MSQMPNIKPDVNVTKERDEKKGGLLGLLSRLTGGGAGGGATGGLGGLGGAAAGGGLLATKAGLIGLVLAGTTVAGGIGMIGWTAFGPGSDSPSNPALQLFASKPKDAASGSFGLAPVAKDGTSQSLSFAAQANAPKAGPGEGDAAAAAAATGDAAPADGATAGSAATPHMGESVATNNAAAPKAGLQNVKKLGELSKSFGGGGSAGSASAGPANVNPAGATASSASGSKGALGGFGKGNASNAKSVGRGLSRARGGSATRQAMGALRDNRSAYSSQGGGRTYDGGVASGGGVAGPEAGMAGLGGPGVGSGNNPMPTSTPNTAKNNEFEPPPTPPSKNVTPYQKALDKAKMLLGAASLLLLVAYGVSKMEGMTMGTAKMIVMALAAVAALLAVAAIAIGAMISGGKYGQPLQGGLIAVAGGCLAATAGMLMYNAYGVEGDPSTKVGATGMFTADTTTFMMLCGGAGMLATAATMMNKPKSFPASEFEGRKVPDVGYHYQVKPLERARYTA